MEENKINLLDERVDTTLAKNQLKRFNIATIILMCVAIVFYIAMVAFVAPFAVSYLNRSEDNSAIARFLYFFFGVMLFGGGFSSMSVGISIAGLILTAKNGAKPWKLIVFIILIILPITTEIIFICLL